MDFVPDESAIKTDHIKVDKETADMLSALGESELPGLVEEVPIEALKKRILARASIGHE
ncbi:hypothetical protein SLEP1_g23725 [Rubroshorea leprosula]|uniref:Uncharacterized protein n=1 Tax=Rubroshorea leprosula TaxID=152421 RepID=A0AAV5JML2_9ROSI|nr:hypothetical protein SLEP1_g23725 [Rubroshorea leprosula]